MLSPFQKIAPGDSYSFFFFFQVVSVCFVLRGSRLKVLGLSLDRMLNIIY